MKRFNRQITSLLLTLVVLGGLMPMTAMAREGETAVNPYAGKTIACIGDSITVGVGVTKDETDYVTLLAQSLEMEYIRLGASGTTLCTGGHATCNVEELTEENLAGADVVTILVGINDFVQARKNYYALGTINSADTSTIYGAAHMWCRRIEELRQKDSLKNTEFYFLTPVITSWNNSVSSARDWNQDKTNIHGYTLRDLCNAIIEVCTLYNIPVVDLNLISGLYYNNDEDNSVAEFGGDGAHPGAVGHQMMASAIKAALLQNNLRDDHVHSYGSWITTTYPGCEDGEQQRVCAICRVAERKVLSSNGHIYENGICTICGAEQPSVAEKMTLRYDDHVDMTGKTVEIIDAGVPTSYQVGYGVEENTLLDTAVVTVEGNTLVATGIGTAMVKIDGILYEVKITAAPISLLLLIGQSNMEGNEGDANQSIVCPDGMVYATYGDRYDMDITNATHYAPSALTGQYREINAVGGTDGLSDYPVYMLTDEGDGRKGPDSGFAYEWVQQTGEKVWIVNASHGGTSLDVWQPGTTQYEECQAMFGACAETLRKEIAAGHFTLNHVAYFWCQGCNDWDKTAEWYVNNYLTMHEALKTELAFDHDSDESTEDVTFEFGGIIPVRAGHDWRTYYREGTYSDTTSASYYESFKDLQMSGPRVAQYWMGNNPELEDIWNVCTIGEDWVWMPDGTNGVTEYFNKRYTGGTVDYDTQVRQQESWYAPTTPAAVHDSIHYNQIGYNEVGRESVRNALIYMGINPDYEEETAVKFVDWTGYREVDEIYAYTEGNSGTLVVPIVSPVTRCKDVTYILSRGLSYEWYDLTAISVDSVGVLEVVGAADSVSVVKQKPGALYINHLSELPERFCAGTNLWPVLEHDAQYYTVNGWGVHSSNKVFSVTIPAQAGDLIWATSMGANGVNGNTISTGHGIRVTFFGEYGVICSLTSGAVYTEFSTKGYLTAPEGTTAVNIPMWSNSDDNELYILNRPHGGDTCDICGNNTHIHSWSQWQIVAAPGPEGPGKELRSCAVCGESQTREVEGVWQTHGVSEHLVQLPDSFCNDTNLWTILPHDDYYYHSGVRWAKHESGTVFSVTFPVRGGEWIFATSFGTHDENGNTIGTGNGIRVTFFGVDGVLKTMAPEDTYKEFAANGGYLIVPEGAVAVNVPMYGNGNGHELYILNAKHSYKNGICTVCGSSVLALGYTHAIPENQGVQNAIDRAYRMTDVEWIPLLDVPGVQTIEGEYTVVNFEAGTAYKGIPYSGVTANDCYVGLNVSLESFLTALENKNSVLYTENLFSSNPKSATYFGTVCSKFAQYVLDVPGSYNTSNVADIPGMYTVAMPGEYTVDQIKLGDVVLHTADHTTVCTDILYDADGNVAYVEISEAVMPLTRRMLWSPEEFAEHFADYRLCRYQYLADIPAVDVVSIGEDYALMPRYGDKYNYKVSSTKGVVDVLESGYSKAVVLRDGAVVEEITLNGANSFSFDRSLPGYLEMYLEKADGSRSGSVYACVVKSSVSVTDSSEFVLGKLTVDIDGSCGTPLYVQVGSAHAIFCNVEGRDGTVELTFSPSKISTKQVRVAYQNEYGIYLSSWTSFAADTNPSGDPLLSQGEYWNGYNITPNDPTPVIQEDKEGYWSYTMVPVEGNATYYSLGATRMWFLDENGNGISTYNAYKDGEIPFQFTTPAGTVYVSIAYAPNLVEQGAEKITIVSHIHTYESTVTAPTCTEKGYTTYTCACSDSYVDSYVAALGHTKEIIPAVVPTCTTTGLTEGSKCGICSEVLTAQTEVSAKGHTEVVDKAVAPTCTYAGLTEGKRCSICGTVTVAQETIPAKGHTEETVPGKAATCVKTGLTDGKRCSECGTITVAQKTIRALGHTYDDKVDGTCNRCGGHRETTENRTVMHMFRMYDPNSGEHFYTGSTEERENLVAAGWNYEGVGFTFSKTTGAPVYRLYDRYNTYEHLYTMDEAEKDMLIAQGWELEGVAFNSAYDTEVPQYRLHNPNETRGAYHFTASAEERDNLIAAGWEYQGIGFYSTWK